MLWFFLIAVCIVILVSGVYVFVVACLRRKELPWLVESELQRTPVGKYYPYIAQSYQWLLEHNVRDIYIQSKDDLRLHAWWVPADQAKGTVLLAHGYRSTPLLDFGAAFSLYHERGFNLLIPNQRSHGNSEGRYITFGVRESEDMFSWIAYHNQHFGHQPLLLSGISMGASTMLYLADQDLPDNVCGIIADCGFTSPKEIICSVFRRVIHLPATPSIWVCDILAHIFGKFNLSEKDTRRSLASSKLPVLLIHGKEDGFVPCEMTEENYLACKYKRHLLLVDGADHGLSFIEEPERYIDAVDTFLKCYLYQERGDTI